SEMWARMTMAAITTGQSIGPVTYQNTLTSLAPSTRAASLRSAETPRQPERNSAMMYPTSAQPAASATAPIAQTLSVLNQSLARNPSPIDLNSLLRAVSCEHVALLLH